jgi:superfamily II DNA or RNA helicase
MTVTLRPYQQQAIDNTYEMLVKRRLESGIIHLFTSAGKSVVASELVRQRFNPQEGHRVIFAAPTVDLVFQMHANFKQLWPESQLPVKAHNTVYPGLGIVMEKLDDVKARIICASTPTLANDVLADSGWEQLSESERDRIAAMTEKEQQNALNEIGKAQWKIDNAPITVDDICVDAAGDITKSPRSRRRVLVSERFDRILANGGLPTFIIHDEAHHSVSDGILLLMRRLQQIARLLNKPAIYLVGLTATPVRQDQRGLGNLYKCIIISRDFRWAQRHGYCAPFAQPIRIMAKTGLEGYSVARKIQNWTEFIIKTWQEKAGDRPTVFFTDKVEQADLSAVEASKVLAKAFNEAGVPAVHLDGGCCIGPSGEVEKKSERRKYFKQLIEGKIKVICNFAVMIEGVDVPPISCVALLRKMNEVQLTQAIGRAVRIFKGNEWLPEKKDMLLIDYAGEALNVVPVGTLMGFKVDEVTKEFVEEEDDAEDELMPADGMAVADLLTQNGLVQGVDAAYSPAQIVSKSQGDWYIDSFTGAMSLQVGDKDTFVITMPQHTMASNMHYLLSEAEQVVGGGSADIGEFMVPVDQLRQYIEFFMWAKTLFENFVLWHTVAKDKTYTIPRKTWLAAEPALDVLEAEAVQYAFHHVEGQVNALMKKHRSWKYDGITTPQVDMLASLLNTSADKIDHGMSKGDASKLISHLMAYRAVAPFFQAVDKALAPFQKYML